MILAEQVLLGHLTDTDSLETLSAEGFHQGISQTVIPTELIRKIADWAITYYWASGRKVGPSREAILDVWGDRMEAMEIGLGDPTEEIDSIEWAITALRAQHAVSMSQRLIREIAASVAKADPTAKVAAVIEGGRQFHQLGQALSSRRSESEAGIGFEEAVLRHEDRRINGHKTHGMTLGLDLIDQHTLGLHPGELAIFAMTSGGGKSWLGGRTTLHSWKQGRRCVLVTLENDLEMTFDRLCCMHARVNYTKWQRGEAEDEEVERVLLATEQIQATEHQPVITMIQAGERDPLSIVRRAHTLGADDLIIDQLSYIEAVPGSKARERHQIVAEILRELRGHIRDDAAGKLPCLLLAQINREGRAASRKTGRVEFEHLGLSTEVENIADYVAAGFQSEDHKALQRAIWQELKFRRGATQDFDMRWRLDVGDIRALGLVEAEAS
jgi:hypothetical protein